jgi:ribonuclease R
VEGFGLFAQGIDLPAEGLIHISSLQDDYYDYDATTHSLVGRRRGNAYQLGDVVQVEVFHVDVDRRELDFRLVRRLERSKSTRSPAKASDKRPTRAAALKNKPRASGKSGKSAREGRHGAAKDKRKGRKPRKK